MVQPLTAQCTPKTLWTLSFLSTQGHDTEENVTMQDKKSTMSLEENGKGSSGKRTRAVNICCFVTTVQIEKDNMKIMHCPVDDMVDDFMTKGLQGLKISNFQNAIVGF